MDEADRVGTTTLWKFHAPCAGGSECGPAGKQHSFLDFREKQEILTFQMKNPLLLNICDFVFKNTGQGKIK